VTGEDVLADIARHAYCPTGDAELVAELERTAQRELRRTGRPQAVHHHGWGLPCVAGCVVFRYAEADRG
jgi:hypothetical protein